MLASPSSYSSLHDRSINTEVVRARNSDFPESQQAEKMVDQCPKRPSYSSQNSDFFYIKRASLIAQLVKNPQAMWETWVRSMGWEDLLEKGTLPTPVFWPGEFHGLYSPWGHKESDTTEQLSLSLHLILKGGEVWLVVTNSLVLESFVLVAVCLRKHLHLHFLTFSFSIYS